LRKNREALTANAEEQRLERRPEAEAFDVYSTLKILFTVATRASEVGIRPITLPQTPRN